MCPLARLPVHPISLLRVRIDFTVNTGRTACAIGPVQRDEWTKSFQVDSADASVRYFVTMKRKLLQFVEEQMHLSRLRLFFFTKYTSRKSVGASPALLFFAFRVDR